MANRAILVITHGEFGIEIIKSAEMIMGPQNNLRALALRPGESVDALREKANEIVEENEKNGLETILLVDLLGGSPSNVSLSLLCKYDLHILTGINMPMLIELLTFYQTVEETKNLIETVQGTGASGIHHLNRSFLKK
ncbi:MULTISPECIES: PTS sugar transporter subunit IIA [Niallia]|uniref:PTS system fructose subfamily transporter subunit IIA n=1 Tax=Niallia alba TaxID=2729105 RepID=A0A7Y0KD64_9BACI|nr:MULTISPECIES: PTS system fructose subfamily transporter subunit IIA [Niallia]MDU1846209.1 PTS mannose transporter subunit IID [Niallia nealsonii]NMO79500.1 PTS system fructose subfamily transporter subunit IIA [Niallia alba]UTI42806.1 PTS mannose transporter subunit IID [Niallia sp. RD1]